MDLRGDFSGKGSEKWVGVKLYRQNIDKNLLLNYPFQVSVVPCSYSSPSGATTTRYPQWWFSLHTFSSLKHPPHMTRTVHCMISGKFPSILTTTFISVININLPSMQVVRHILSDVNYDISNSPLHRSSMVWMDIYM